MTPDQMLLVLTGSLFIIGAGGVYLWRKGDDKTDKVREELIILSSELNEIGFVYSGDFVTKLAAGNIWSAMAAIRVAVSMMRDKDKRLAHFGEIAVTNLPKLLDDPRFGPQIRKAVKDKDILIASTESNTSSPV